MDKREPSKQDCCSPPEKIPAEAPSCCPPGSTTDAEFPDMDSPWIIGSVNTPAGNVPLVRTKLCYADNLGTWKARWGINRNRYSVAPGLYAVGNPTHDSPVLVSANYKLSFDHLRSRMDGRSAWILVLDTRGINVWCAAGKGTFGTDEIVKKVSLSGLVDIVSHRRLIVPQLGATGVAAHDVKLRCGFNIVYGPVRANDLPEFIDAGFSATTEMRRVRFSFIDRVVLIPVELVSGMKYAVLIALFFFLTAGFGPGIYSTSRAVSDGAMAVLLLLGAFITGAVLTPVLLPWLPGRAFSLKGLWIGLIYSIAVWYFMWGSLNGSGWLLTSIAWGFIFVAITSMVALNFTGASTYTSLSGVRREMRAAIPLISLSGVSGLLLWIVSRFI